MQIAASQYLDFQPDGDATGESFDLAFSKIGGICRIRRLERENPEKSRLYHIRNVLRKRLQGRYYHHEKTLELIKIAESWDVPPDQMMFIASTARNWSNFVSRMNEAIDDRMAEKGEGHPG
jgi:hypothetical protein